MTVTRCIENTFTLILTTLLRVGQRPGVHGPEAGALCRMCWQLQRFQLMSARAGSALHRCVNVASRDLHADEEGIGVKQLKHRCGARSINLLSRHWEEPTARQSRESKLQKTWEKVLLRRAIFPWSPSSGGVLVPGCPAPRRRAEAPKN